MREPSSQSRDQSQRRKSGKGARKKNRKNFSRGPNGGGANGNNGQARQANGNNRDRDAQPQPPANGGMCQKCGHPAPDGKLCNFHRALLNSIRNDFGKKSGRNYATI